MNIKVGEKKYSVEFWGLNNVECAEDLVNDCVFYNEEEEMYELNEHVEIEDVINYLKEEVDKSTYEEEEYVEVSIDGELVERYYGEDEIYYFNNKKVLENLKEMIGKEVDANDIICCFEDTENEVIVDNTNVFSNFEGYGKCECVDAYENTEESEIYHLYISENDILVDIG